jgi:hypothetical protein
VERVTLDTAEGPKDLIRWTVTIPQGEEAPVIVDALSSLLFTPKAKARRWARALLGKDVTTVAAEELEGCACLALIAEDDNGFTKLADILPPIGGTKAK